MGQNDLSEKVGSIDVPEKTSANISEETPRVNNDFLKMLEFAFFTPMISLLKVYLMASNGNRKTIENCVLDFRAKHGRVFKSMYTVDFGFRLVYLFVLLIVVLRGLGVVEYIKSVFS